MLAAGLAAGLLRVERELVTTGTELGFGAAASDLVEAEGAIVLDGAAATARADGTLDEIDDATGRAVAVDGDETEAAGRAALAAGRAAAEAVVGRAVDAAETVRAVEAEGRAIGAVVLGAETEAAGRAAEAGLIVGAAVGWK